VQERGAINLEIGSGPATATVPALEGRTVDEARELLEQRGLELGQQNEDETDDPREVGRVIQADPRPGTEVEGGSAVNVVIGAERTTVQVPDVTNRQANEAEQILRQAGFQVQRQDPGNAGDQGTVVATNPQAGTQAPRGSQVVILIGGGDTIQMPRLVGLEADEAVDRLRDRGHTGDVQTQTQQVQDEDDAGRVLQQSVDEGDTIPADQDILLVVGNFQDGLVG
jgi:beta-lactam-binding protein with PASTA domain